MDRGVWSKICAFLAQSTVLAHIMQTQSSQTAHGRPCMQACAGPNRTPTIIMFFNLVMLFSNSWNSKYISFLSSGITFLSKEKLQTKNIINIMQYLPTVLNQLIAWLSNVAILALSLQFFGVSQYAYPQSSRCLSLWNHNTVKGIAKFLLLKPE